MILKNKQPVLLFPTLDYKENYKNRRKKSDNMSLINLLIVVSIFQCVHCLTLEVPEHKLTELKSEIRKEVLEDLENWKKVMKAELKKEILDLRSDMLEMRQGINECYTNPCQHNGTCQGNLLMGIVNSSGSA